MAFRTVWVFLFLLGVLASIYFCWQMWMKWEESPTLISLDTHHFPLKSLSFPPITICNVNKVSTKRQLKYFNRYSQTACVMECTGQRTLQLCQWRPFFFRGFAITSCWWTDESCRIIVLIALVVHFQPVESTVGGAGHLRDVQLISGRFDHQLLVVMPQLRWGRTRKICVTARHPAPTCGTCRRYHQLRFQDKDLANRGPLSASEGTSAILMRFLTSSESSSVAPGNHCILLEGPDLNAQLTHGFSLRSNGGVLHVYYQERTGTHYKIQDFFSVFFGDSFWGWLGFLPHSGGIISALEAMAHITETWNVDPSIILIRYNSPTNQRIQSIVIVSWSIAAAMGGLLGVGFGFSFISVIEMCYFASKRLLMNICAKKEEPVEMEPPQPLFIRTFNPETPRPLIITSLNLNPINHQRVARSNYFKSLNWTELSWQNYYHYYYSMFVQLLVRISHFGYANGWVVSPYLHLADLVKYYRGEILK